MVPPGRELPVRARADPDPARDVDAAGWRGNAHPAVAAHAARSGRAGCPQRLAGTASDREHVDLRDPERHPTDRCPLDEVGDPLEGRDARKGGQLVADEAQVADEAPAPEAE